MRVPYFIIFTTLFLFSCDNATLPKGAVLKEQSAIPERTDKVKVVGVKDGDTIEVLIDGRQETVRLFAIDCPEKAQAYGQVAKKFTSALCYGKYVSVEPQAERDQYDRIIGTVYIDDTLVLNEALLKAGMAWHYKRYSNNEQYSYYENNARAAHLGLWADDNPTEPWNWRHSNKRK